MLISKISSIVRSPRNSMSLITVIVLAAIIYFSRDELRKAWELLSQADLLLLALLIPFQIMVYYAGGEMIFAYLRRKKLIGHISWIEQTRIALELNLVNHVFPSGGVSGISYTTWRLRKLGVGSATSTFAQLIRYVAGFVSLMVLLIIAVVALAIDGEVNRYILAPSFLLVLTIVIITAVLFYMFSSGVRMERVAKSTTRLINRFISFVTFKRRPELVKPEGVERFFSEMHRDFGELLVDKRALVRPLVWGAIYAIFDIAMFMVAFWSLGASVNPAILLVGYGVAGLVGLVAFTPGGAGVYEVVMIFFLTMAGVSPDLAIAGIILTRVILLAGTIVFGYIFYQHALIKYGKRTDTPV